MYDKTAVLIAEECANRLTSILCIDVSNLETKMKLQEEPNNVLIDKSRYDIAPPKVVETIFNVNK